MLSLSVPFAWMVYFITSWHSYPRLDFLSKSFEDFLYSILCCPFCDLGSVPFPCCFFPEHGYIPFLCSCLLSWLEALWLLMLYFDSIFFYAWIGLLDIFCFTISHLLDPHGLHVWNCLSRTMLFFPYCRQPVWVCLPLSSFWKPVCWSPSQCCPLRLLLVSLSVALSMLYHPKHLSVFGIAGVHLLELS